MKIVLLVLSVLAVIVATLLIAAIFLKKDYLVVREIIINRPRQEVFDYIKYLKNQKEWSIWGSTDPNMKTTYSGIDGTVGFIYGWESDNKRVGRGKQELKKIVDGEYVEYTEWDLRYAGNPHTQGYWVIEAVSDNVTRIKWGYAGRVNYPLNLMIVFFEKLMGDGSLYPSLASLKTKMEKDKNEL